MIRLALLIAATSGVGIVSGVIASSAFALDESLLTRVAVGAFVALLVGGSATIAALTNEDA